MPYFDVNFDVLQSFNENPRLLIELILNNLSKFNPTETLLKTHFGGFYMALKAEELLEHVIDVIDVIFNWVDNTLPQKLEQILGDESFKIMKAQIVNQLNQFKLKFTEPSEYTMKTRNHRSIEEAKSILKNAMEIIEEWRQIRWAARDQIVLTLSKILPLPKEPILLIIDELVSLQNENNSSDIWRVEDPGVVANSDLAKYITIREKLKALQKLHDKIIQILKQPLTLEFSLAME